MEETLNITIEKQTINVKYSNINSLRVNYYEIDLEVLFSGNPFLKQGSGDFGYVKPNRSLEYNISTN